MMAGIIRPSAPPSHSPRGGILLEALLALALFSGAALLTLGAARSAFTGLSRAERQHLAADIAASRLAELEAGLINLADLRGAELQTIGSIELDDAFADRWIVEARTQRSEHRGLTLVELTVREAGNAPDAVSITLRRLLTLREIDPDEYEEDDLLRGLPRATGGAR
jgi:hypothetical protein